jgi:hypothetical protein
MAAAPDCQAAKVGPMAIDQINIVDSIGLDPSNDEIQQIITDHLAWDNSERDDNEHMYFLQEKINTYLRFIESGELYTAYPQSKGKALVIRIVAKHDMTTNAKEFLKKIQETLLTVDYRITFERLSSP